MIEVLGSGNLARACLREFREAAGAKPFSISPANFDSIISLSAESSKICARVHSRIRGENISIIYQFTERMYICAVGARSHPPQSDFSTPISGKMPFWIIPAVAAVLSAMAGLIALFAMTPDENNDTMRDIEENLKRLEEECKRREAEADQRVEDANAAANVREAVSKRREDEAFAEAQEAKEALQKGIRPVVMPTREQYSAAKQRVQYDPLKCHFAVCGTSGSGKSSLINAFRGLKPSDENAAEVGVTECTSEVTRYPDPRNEIPYLRFVWYDIPGAGTLNVPDWQYFNDQGLFVFDFIVIVYDVRFTKIDVGIIKNCLLFNIPFFVVRSKADQHIQNMMNDMDEECERQVIVDKYVKATRSDFDANLEKMAEAPELDEGSRQLLLNQRVYIVSGSTLRGLFQTSEWTRRTPKSSSIIDEKLLLDDMVRHAARRRYAGHATYLWM